MRIRRVPCSGWILLLALNVGLAVALFHVLPPQPRWQTLLEEREEVFAVEPVHGRIFTRGPHGVGVLDLFTGRRLGLVVSGKDFTFYGADRFSADHRYYAVRFNKGRQIGVIDVTTLQTRFIDLREIKDTEDTPSLTFSPDSEWLAVGVEDTNDHPVKVVVFNLTAGKVGLETEARNWFRAFVPRSSIMVCEKEIVSGLQYAVTVWDLATGAKVHESPTFLSGWTDSDKRYHYYSRLWAPDGGTLVACRPATDGKTELVVWDVLKNRPKATLPFDPARDPIELDFAPDGKTLLLTAPPDQRRLLFYDPLTATIRKEHQLPASAAYTSVSPDSTLALCSTGGGMLVFRLPCGELLEQAAAEDERWGFADDFPVTYRLTFKGEMGHRLLDGDFTFHFRDWRTGHQVTFGPQHTDSCWPPCHQIGSRLVFIRSGIEWFPVSPAEEFLRWLLPLGDPPTNRIHCVDLATGRELGRLELFHVQDLKFAEPHGLLVTWHYVQGGPQLVSCWDVPFRPAWVWVLGPPLALTLLALAWRSRRLYRRR